MAAECNPDQSLCRSSSRRRACRRLKMRCCSKVLGIAGSPLQRLSEIVMYRSSRVPVVARLAYSEELTEPRTRSPFADNDLFEILDRISTLSCLWKEITNIYGSRIGVASDSRIVIIVANREPSSVVDHAKPGYYGRRNLVRTASEIDLA
ncbi:hypothetical protein KC319_g23 [Hortaea werneckii]|nr:hypothetical protein KC319_g23 [Hortaea werneckii]